MTGLELVLALVVLLTGGAAPIWLVLTTTGIIMLRKPPGMLEMMGSLHQVARTYLRVILVPALVILVAAVVWAAVAYPRLANLILAGAVAGLLSSLALDVVRLTGYAMGWMPSNMPHTFGRMILGPTAMAGQVKTVGFLYHLLNGIGFGLIYALLFGNAAWWWGIVFAMLIAVLMGISPPVLMSGSGVMMLRKGMGPMAVMLLAHLAMGVVLGLVTVWIAQGLGLLGLLFGL